MGACGHIGVYTSLDRRIVKYAWSVVGWLCYIIYLWYSCKGAKGCRFMFM